MYCKCLRKNTFKIQGLSKKRVICTWVLASSVGPVETMGQAGINASPSFEVKISQMFGLSESLKPAGTAGTPGENFVFLGKILD